jgi:AcrR family transcriptional regulator
MTDTPQTSSSVSQSAARARLIEAGLDVFSTHGYRAATTRMIAERGQVNLAAIPYHFGGKEGLYLAVVDYIIDTVDGLLSPQLTAIRKRIAHNSPDRREGLAMLEELLAVLVDFVVGAADAPRFGRILLREQMSPSNAFDRIYEKIMEPVLMAVTSLLQVISGNGEPMHELRLQAFTLVGQIMIFRSGWETAARYVGLTGQNPEETSAIRCIIIERTRAALGNSHFVMNRN